ncbi:AAA domain-containing protein [Vallitalea guaymasensis]|uniref:AAA domain-containing protein n=1 Tax=Vallitalea guaymasensis TaxID=1185412 RepID=UPI002352B61D|nr:AAA domain-containing protein [Vallitalea guaymasensis]
MKILDVIDYFIEYEGHNILHSIANIKSKLDLKNDKVTKPKEIIEVVSARKYNKALQIIDWKLDKLDNEKKENVRKKLKNLIYTKNISASKDIKSCIDEIFHMLYTSQKKEYIKKQKNDILEVISQNDFLLMYPVYNFGSTLIPMCTYHCTYNDDKVVILEYTFTEELFLGIMGYGNDIDAYFDSKKDRQNFFRSINSYDNNNIIELTDIILEEIYKKIPESKMILQSKQQKHFKVAIDGSFSEYVAPFKEELMLVKNNLQSKKSILLNKYLINETSKEYHLSMSRISHHGSYPFEIDYIKELLPKYGVNEKQWSIIDRSQNSNMLAVTGPPGTGKTTVLKEVIADNFVKKTKALIDVWDKDWTKRKSGVYKSPLGGKNSKNNYSILVSSTNNNAVDNLGDELAKEIKLFNRSKLSRVKSTFCAKMGKKDNIETFIKECFLPLSQTLNDIEEYNEDLSLNKEFINIYNDIEKFNESIALFDNVKDELQNVGVNVFDYDSVNRIDMKLQEKSNQINDDISTNKENIKSLESKINGDQREIIKDNKKIGTLENELDNIKTRQESINNIKSIPVIGRVYSLFVNKEITELEIKTKNVNKELNGYRESILFLSNEINKNEKEINKIKQQITELNDIFNKNKLVIGVISRYLSRYIEFKQLMNNYNINLHVNESRYKICNCEALRMKRSRLFQLALFINEAYIIKCRKQIIEDLTIILNEPDGILFSKHYRSTYIYEESIEKDLRALWEVYFLCFPVITTTLHSLHRGRFHMIDNIFDLLLIDEAGQVMPHYLVGPMYRARRAIIVGDVLQLNPVRNQVYPEVFEKYEKQYGLNDIYNLDNQSAQSFANRVTDYYELLDNKKIGIILEEHRRCEKNIAMFSNDHVYSNRMKIVKKNETKEMLDTNLAFVDVRGIKNKDYTNNAEVNICKAIVAELKKTNPNSEIGIITPYKNQEKLLGYNIKSTNIECGTVHRFQGKGKDIIIISLVVSSIKDKKGLSFLGAEPNFLNVALTRAKKQLIIVGNYDILDGSHYLSKLKETINKYGKVYSFFHNECKMNMEVYKQMQRIMSFSLIKDEQYNRIFGKFEAVRGLLSNDEHYKLLNNLFETTESIEVCSPWINRVVAKNGFIEKIQSYVETGKKYKIFFGNKKSKYTLSSREEIRRIVEKDSINANNDNKIEDEVEMIMSIQSVIGEDLVYKPPMHSKFLIINDQYMVIGSHNWLSKNGLGHNSPHELSCIVEDESMIQYVHNEIMKL